MEKLKEENKVQCKHPFLCSILSILMYYGLVTTFGAITIILGILITRNHEITDSTFKTCSPIYIIICFISMILLNLIFKNLKIYLRGNFFKTLKASSVLLIYETLFLLYTIYIKVTDYVQFKSASEIIFGIIVLFFGIGFIEESLFRGLILNMFAKKYSNKPYGILKILIFPSIFFGAIHLLNIFSDVGIKNAILQSIIAFSIGILLNAIYLRGGNIFVLILIHAIIDASGAFGPLFTKENITLSDSINSTSYATLIYVPLYMLITKFLLRKSKLNEVEETIKRINNK